MSSEADRFFGMAFGVARSYPLLFGTDRSEVVDGIDSGLYFKDKRDKTLGRSYLGVSIEVPFKVARLSLETISPSRDKIDVLVAGRDDIAERNHGALWYVSEGFQMEYGYPWAAMAFDLDSEKVSGVFVPDVMESNFPEILRVRGADLENGVSVFFDSVRDFVARRDKNLRKTQLSWDSIYAA